MASGSTGPAVQGAVHGPGPARVAGTGQWCGHLTWKAGRITSVSCRGVGGSGPMVTLPQLTLGVTSSLSRLAGPAGPPKTGGGGGRGAFIRTAVCTWIASLELYGSHSPP